jgi:prepilin-type N-terminal cleavage/methylation domain-containing protein
MRTLKLNVSGPTRSRSVIAFTLVEVMVAVAIIGVAFTSLYAGMTAGFGVVSVTRENLRATQIMQDRMEVMRMYTWDQLQTFGTSNSYIPSTFAERFYPTDNVYTNSDVVTVANATNGGIYYFGTIDIAASGLTNSYSNWVKKVTVTILWTNANVARTRTLTSFVSAYGMHSYLD